MRINRFFLWLVLLAALPLALTGCSGINSSQSVSPATFFLPGLMNNDAPTNTPSLTSPVSTEIAAVR